MMIICQRTLKVTQMSISNNNSNNVNIYYRIVTTYCSETACKQRKQIQHNSYTSCFILQQLPTPPLTAMFTKYPTADSLFRYCFPGDVCKHNTRAYLHIAL